MPPVPDQQVLLESDDEEALLLPIKLEIPSYTNLWSWQDDDSETTEGEHPKEGPCHPKRWWIKYCEALDRRPLLVKSATSFVLLACADLLAQMVEHLRGIPTHHFVNGPRMLRFGVFGLFGAPWTHYYYDWLDRVLPPTPEPWTTTTAVKVLIDQFLQAPALLALIIMGMPFMEGRGWEGMKHDMELQYLSTLVENWKLWIPATIINIAFVKPSLRVLYDNLIFFIWTIYLSMILNDVDQ